MSLFGCFMPRGVSFKRRLWRITLTGQIACDSNPLQRARMKRYSAFAVAREALRNHMGWERAWASPEPKKKYDVIIVGAGGHGLATAYYLGKNFGITNVAVLEKGWL